MNISLSDKDFELFRKLIYEQSGIHFSEMNRSILETRLRERLKVSGQPEIQGYYHLIQTNQYEMKVLLDSVTTNLTKFFRNTGQFQAFESHVIPDLVIWKRAARSDIVRIWSAGCSTGEEPYSIAMLIKDKLPPDLHSEIIASDLSLKSLMIAQEGFYPENKIEGVPEQYLSRFFDKKMEGYQIKDEIKKMVRFDYHNLKYDSGLRSVDILFCRNVIIYFDDTAQRAVIGKFWDIMSNHSYLFLGHSESLFGMDTHFEFVKTEWAVLYRKFLPKEGPSR
ncbi:MAG: protein-glutamate O-methyltransferase CheR [Spirochaetaceae bacterium]|nr:MAG: protein-glutamate O-methyltransferase CheR [Spirochaetaceae bacterium]